MSKSFEDQWKDALGNASENPPEMVWDKIEQELDKKEESRVIPLWFSPKWIAAGIAAMLVMVIGYGVIQQPQSTNIVQKKSSKNVKGIDKSKSENALNETLAGKSDLPIETNNELLKGKGEKVNQAVEKIKDLSNNNIAQLKERKLSSEGNSLQPRISRKSVNENEIALSNSKQGLANETIASSNEIISMSSAELKAQKEPLNIETSGNDELPQLTLENNEQRLFGEIEPLEALAFQPYGSRFVNKRSMLEVNFEPEEPENIITKEKVYFGMNSGVSPYNTNFEANGFVGEAVAAARQDIGQAYSLRSPSLATESLPQADAGFAANVLPSNLPQNSFKAGNAISVGFNVGKKLWRKFSVEAGFRYLRSSSSMQTNVYTINAKSGEVVPFFQEKYVKSQAQDFQTIISFTENYQQVYNYVGVPLNIVYNLPLIKKFSLSFFGGISGDFFVGSSYKSSNQENTKLSSQETNFNAINISGMEGIRLNYGLGNNWDIQIGVINQHALRSGISDANGATFRPNMLGVNYGVKYQIGE